MINQAAENLHKEKGPIGIGKDIKKEIYTTTPEAKEAGDIEQKEASEKAKELLKKITGTSEEEQTASGIQTTPSLDTKTQQAIKQLNRPEAEEGLTQAYADTEAEIKNSKNEKGTAGILGKIINRINP